MYSRSMSLLLSQVALVTVFLVPANQASAQEQAAQVATDADTTLAPIVVTARRRDEEIQSAPVAVTAMTQEELTKGKVGNLEEAAGRAPNVLFNGQGGPFSIRGVTSLGISGGVDRQPAVGLFLDEVFLARPLGYPFLLEDLERVEVVRGSQTTLYGKNTIGGAVNLISREPGDVMGGEISATIGTNLDRRFKAAFETPIEGTDWAIRTSAAWSGMDGYIDNIPTGSDVSDTGFFSGRTVLTGRIGDATDVKIIADFTRDRSDGGLWYAPLPLALDHRSEHDYDAENSVDSAGISVRLDHAFDSFDVTSITAIRGHDMSQFLDGDFTSAPSIIQGQTEKQRQFSQDLRFSSNEDGPWRWAAGLFYMHENFNGNQYFDMASVPRDLMSRDVFEQKANTFSTFAEVGYFVTPELELTAGARYTYDRKRTSSEISSPSGTFYFGMPGAVDDSVSFSNISPEISATYHVSEGNIVFGKISRGYKSGGISPFIEADGSANKYDPEETTSYEIGAKATSADGRYALAA